jgi:glucose/arabinose dehydrogenase
MSSTRLERRPGRLLTGALPSILLAALALAGPQAGAEPPSIDYREQTLAVGGKTRHVRLPEGLRLELLSDAMRRPRLFAFDPAGDLVVGSRADRVYRLAPPYREPRVLLRLPGYPHSVAFRQGRIFIATTDTLFAAPYRPGHALARSELQPLARLPGGGGHSSRSVGVGPDGRVYVALGLSGNCSDQYLGEGYPFAQRRGGVLVLEKAGGQARLVPFASGVRNPVGFDWQPGSGTLYASNNGPDHWGYELPPEYFSRLTAGSFHGMPWYQFDGEGLRRDRCVAGEPPRDDPTVPVATFPARNAPMGVAFVPEGGWGGRFAGDAVVALHGSWATAPTGGFRGDPASRRPPKLVLVRFEGGEAVRVDDLATGFQLPDGERWARPVGVGFGPDGALYLTSDAGTEGLFRLAPDGGRTPP